jgi:SAM-dependent methyltransferase
LEAFQPLLSERNLSDDEPTPGPDLADTPTVMPLVGDYQGAAPADFFTADPTPPPPSAPAAAEVLGANPVAVLSGPMGSDALLPMDAVEIIQTLGEDVPTPEQPAAPPAPQSRREFATGPAPVGVESFQTSEPREVDPDILEMMESAEHLIATGEPASSTDAHLTSTPPPVPVESPATDTPRQVLAAETLFQEYETSAPSESPLPEALARRSLKKRSKPWYEEVFDEDYLRTLPFTTAEQTGREVAFIRESLALPDGSEVLDVACGYGRHALEFAETGLRMTGLDLSLPLLIRAADDAQRRGLSVNFVHADMREMEFHSQFDGAYCMMSSFGYFDEETNLRVASSICRSIKPGGRFLLDIINRDYIVGGLPSRVWWEGDGCVVLEEVDFNYHTSRVVIRRSVVFSDGRQTEQEISMRAYSLHELGKLLRQAGFRVLEVSGSLATRAKFFGSASRNIIAVCERPES